MSAEGEQVSTIERLPEELKLLLLRSLDQFRSLRAWIQASPDMLHVYSCNRDTIISCILTRALPRKELRPEARAVIRTTQMIPDTAHIYQDFIQECQNGIFATDIIPRSFLCNQLMVFRHGPLHEAIETLSRQICQRTVTATDTTSSAGPSSQISASISGHHNILDVQRALYRIEIYINLAKAACPAHMLLRFLRHYPQPEIGEINRVHRYLTQQIGLLQKKTYKALLSPDDPVLQRWLARRQDKHTAIEENPAIQHYLSCGLCVLHTFFSFDLEDESRETRLRMKAWLYEHRGTRAHFLGRDLIWLIKSP